MGRRAAAAEETIVWEGVESLRPLLVPIADLKPHPRNPRRHDLPKIAESFRTFGQQKPIVALLDGTIVAGHGSTEATGELLGWTHIAVVKTSLAEDEAERFLLADNRASDLGYYDQEVLATILSDLMDAGRLEGTGYTPDDAEDLIAELGRIKEADRMATDARHSETPEEIAAREALRQGGAVMREVVLMLSEEQHERFGVAYRRLRQKYGTEGVIETVYRAVMIEAEMDEEPAAAAAE